MHRFTEPALLITLIAMTTLAAAAGLLMRHGFSARAEPWSGEAFIARHLRRLAIPAGARTSANPIPEAAEVIVEARAHFADHCATCHANNGSGETAIGRSLYPKAPDMREPLTQSLSDGELFYIIHNGIRFTGMPAWGAEDPKSDLDSWKLVHFIRRLPKLTAEEIDEMKNLNPKSVHEIEEENDIKRFLSGEEVQAHHH
ncbi:MAG: c-type cytochrome [Deltaproteobacteria bacterium]|nr:c-type cytochrome [Deltaproteobacteria bacterium]MBI3389222.1 c-type cytochrome [Deltaproteobacteria bacterium]